MNISTIANYFDRLWHFLGSHAQAKVRYKNSFTVVLVGEEIIFKILKLVMTH